jgi:hypothetical protein
MSMHPDGSRTVYNFDVAQHKAVATTTGQDGKLRETIRYVLDDAGRFSSAKSPDLTATFGSRVATSTTMRAGFSKKLKAQPTGRFNIRSSTVTTHPESRPAIPSSMHPAN